jgi:hypothetical protein
MDHIRIDVPKRESQIRILQGGELIETRIRTEPEPRRHARHKIPHSEVPGVPRPVAQRTG